MVDWTRCRQVCQHPINERALSNRHVYARFLNILAQVVAPCATQCGALFDRLAMARERLSADGHDTLMGLLRAGDPHREVWFAWNANEVVCQIYDHADRHLAIEWVDEIVRDFVDREMPLEVRRLGRTSAAGAPRSPPGTVAGSATARPRPSTTW